MGTGEREAPHSPVRCFKRDSNKIARTYQP